MTEIRRGGYRVNRRPPPSFFPMLTYEIKSYARHGIARRTSLCFKTSETRALFLNCNYETNYKGAHVTLVFVNAVDIPNRYNEYPYKQIYTFV